MTDKFKEPLAIVGMNCQFPGPNEDLMDVDALYNMLLNGESSIKNVPIDRWDIEKYYDKNRQIIDKINSKKGGFLANSDLFDSAFFKISALEAKQMDPQHRVFLEVAIRALNHANIRLDSLANSNAGVYCGISTQEYSQLNYKDNITFNAYTPIGEARSAAVGRLCHFLKLKGPSMVVDTACSSSLSALYLAASALTLRECNMAIVGGVHLNLCPEAFIGFTKANMLSASGQCNSFAVDADGFVLSEGCGVVIVKRLSDAVRENDKIYAVIKSVVMNQDGGGASLSAPNIDAQIAMHKAALEQAEMAACDIDYIESHGAGTIVGDAVEWGAIQSIHQGHHQENNPLIIGALKSNLGHTLTSSGIAALIKVICALDKEIIPSNLQMPMSEKIIDSDLLTAVLPATSTPFPRNLSKKRVAQVSNFSFSGINVAAIIEESPAVSINLPTADNGKAQCFVISAHTKNSLEQILARHAQFLSMSLESLNDICKTLIHCRDHFKWRCAVIATDKETLIKKIEANEYELKKVVLNDTNKPIGNDANSLAEYYLAGGNISSFETALNFRKVNLPLYIFDRKSYWHEPRIRLNDDSTKIKHHQENESIAIIGMSCRFPKAPDIESFLSLLERGDSGMVDIPIDRWDNSKYYDADVDAPGKLCIKQLGLIENIQHFDADFFNISPREAKLMSPNLRIALETTYHALEDANLTFNAIKHSNTGVFMGCENNEYPSVLADQGLNIDELDIYVATGNVMSALPGRISYTFDLHGPIQNIDTACSSSLTAIHNASASLQMGDCDMAIAGGINLLLRPEGCITLSKAKMLSPKSRCKTFSEDADGYARSEGCGVIILKRLEDAIHDNDNVLAIIKGSSINSDGKSAGLTVPNGEAQEAVIHSALKKSGLTPADIDYIETHGTGTPIADPIEVNTLSNIFSEYHSDKKPLYISSVKTNIGHCESASGMASIIKAVLSLQTQKIFKHLNFTKLNTAIKLKNMRIPLNTIDWSKEEGRRCVGVNSFGFSGANAHAILQQAPVKTNEERELLDESLLILSAKKRESLELLLASYQQYLSITEEQFADICYTAATCRHHFLYRVGIKARTAAEAASAIERHDYTIYQIKKEKEELLVFSTIEALQRSYQEGAIISWSKFYDSLNTKFQKVKIPRYQFTGEVHWYGNKDRLQDAPTPTDWYFESQWPQQLIAKNNRKFIGKRWLLIGGKTLKSNFISHGLEIRLEEDDYSLDQLDGIIFAESFEREKFSDKDAHIEFQKHLIKKLLNLVQTLNRQKITPQLIVLSSQSIAEIAKTNLNVSNSCLLGFCKSLALECPKFKTILIDIDGLDQEVDVKQVLDEIHHNHGQYYEPVIAYRDGKRLGNRLIKTTIPNKKLSIHTRARYLITGGSGGLGLVTAQALLSAGARELVLIARDFEKPSFKETLKKIESIYPGRTIRTFSLDITDKESLRHLLIELNEDNLLKGIIHAAGSTKVAPLDAHQETDVDNIFAAKVQGGWYLHELSQHCQLDFFVVYSSLAATTGSNNLIAYSASNSFLDALIATRNRLGLVGTCIQWSMWGETGMPVNYLGRQNHSSAVISNSHGQTLIKIILNANLKHIIVVPPEQLELMLDSVPKPIPLFHQCLAADLKIDGHTLEKTLSNWLRDYIKLRDEEKLTACKEMLLDLCQKVQELSSTDELDEDEGFYDLGFDSLMIVELAFALKDMLEPTLKITINIAFDYPSINKLSNFIYSELKANLTISLPESSSAKIEDNLSKHDENDIAIIGMSCSLPNAKDIESFEIMLEQGHSGMKDIPLDRWDNQLFYDSNINAPNKLYIKKLGLMDDIKSFDARLFGISPREADLMEPQQRIFLENCYRTLENANYHPESLRGSLTGVFAGVGYNEYYAQLEQAGISKDELSIYGITGNVANLISGRVAYTFDFKGPSISIDTACSSSLVAIHYACQSLKNREIDQALAGGINVIIRPETNITLCKSKTLSPDSLCKTFDESADGFARGEGCGVIFLKRLADAVRDKDRIFAVIKGTAVNSDGKTAGLTVPNGKSQEAVMLKALSQTQLSSHDINYIEAHGTGTPLGDPIEVHAINKIYGHQRNLDNPLYIGSVKTNIGHLESASGVASVIKTVLSLQKHKIYKHLNFNKLNPHIQLEDSKIALQTIDWESSTSLRCAGINAFGFSGTNAHVILQEYPMEIEQRLSSQLQEHALLLSAKSIPALENLIEKYQQYLNTTSDEFSNICFTAAICREHYEYRAVIIAKTNAKACLNIASGKFAKSHGKKNGLQSLEATKIYVLTKDYLEGKNIDWELYFQKEKDSYIKVALPYYPFDKIEFWPIKKSNAIEASLPSNNIAAPFILQHLYDIQWQKFSIDPHLKIDLPDFWVLANDRSKAIKQLGALNYQFISPMDDIENFADKNIILFFEQDDFKELFHLCQHMFKSCPKRFILVTERAYAIQNNNEVNPYQTMAATFWKSFKQELGYHNNYTIDVDPTSTLTDVLNVLCNHNSEESQFAVRDSIYIPKIQKKEIPDHQNWENYSFDNNANYLIVGGTGGLAKPLIEYLVSRGTKHITLVSRSKCPAATKTLMKDASRSQVSIKHFSADASDYLQMEKIIDKIQCSEHPLKGIFHLAGVIHDGLIVNLTDEDLSRVLDAKMKSALILHQLTESIPLELFVLFSSSSSILGAKGQSTYAAANGFLDGLAHYRHHKQMPAIAINWGPFHTVGMAASLTNALQLKGFISLDVQSIHILDRLLLNKHPQILACAIDWDVYLNKQEMLTEEDLLKTLRLHNHEESVSILEKILCEITANVLRLAVNEHIKVTDDLFSLGLDSLMFLEIRHRIHDLLRSESLTLPIEYFINNPRIDKIARYIADEIESNFKDNNNQLCLENNTDAPVALCDFQYLFWALNKFDYSFNVGMQIRLSGKLNTNYVAQAFNTVIKQNPVFGIRFDEDVPMQMQSSPQQCNIIYQDISLSDECYQLDIEFRNNIVSIIPLTEQPLIRIYLYKLNDDLHELHIVIPHIIVDDASSVMVWGQFKQHYEALTKGITPRLLPAQNSFLNYVKQHHVHYEKNLEDKTLFWKTYNKKFNMLQLGRGNHLRDAFLYQDSYLSHYTQTSQLIEPFIEWHKERNLNVSSGLIAACQSVFYKISQQKKIPIIIMHSGREGSQYKAVVGLFAEYKRINLIHSKKDTFLQCIQKIEENLTETAPYQKCSLYIKDKGLKGASLSIGQYASYTLNKLLSTKNFKQSNLHKTIINYYLANLSKISFNKNKTFIKYKLNQLFKWNIPILPPKKLNVVISITPSFFAKEPEQMRFGNIDYHYASHFGCLDRPIGNQTLWIYFTKNQNGEHQLSINGPLTTACKDQFASHFNEVLTSLLQNQ